MDESNMRSYTINASNQNVITDCSELYIRMSWLLWLCIGDTAFNKEGILGPPPEVEDPGSATHDMHEVRNQRIRQRSYEFIPDGDSCDSTMK